MGDDEFFGTNDTSTSSRNPLSLDKLKSLSRRLLIIAFPLFQREGQADWQIYLGECEKSDSVPRCGSLTRFTKTIRSSGSLARQFSD